MEPAPRCKKAAPNRTEPAPVFVEPAPAREEPSLLQRPACAGPRAGPCRGGEPSPAQPPAPPAPTSHQPRRQRVSLRGLSPRAVRQKAQQICSGRLGGGAWGDRAQLPSEKAGSNKQDLSGHSFVPTWPAQAVQQPSPDTGKLGFPLRPSPAPGNARKAGTLRSGRALGPRASRDPLPCALLRARERGGGSAGSSGELGSPGRDLRQIAWEPHKNVE